MARKDSTGRRGGKVKETGAADFGVPAKRANTEYARRKGREAKFRPAGSHTTDARQDIGTTQQVRDSGVGGRDAGPGGRSSGDIDTDIVGIGGSGLAQGGPDENVSEAESTTGSSDEFASGGRAKGENTLPKGKVGGSKRVRGSTNDRSGDDRETAQRESGGVRGSADEDAKPEVQEQRRRARRAR